jgi:hypothetical protein
MAMAEEKTGAEILAIAHNGNLSNGRMFPIIESFTGRRIDREYAENRGPNGGRRHQTAALNCVASVSILIRILLRTN